MPLAEERSLRRSAKRHGFTPGSPRYDRYVYGTLNKQKYNHAGWLGPDKLLRNGTMKFDYSPTVKNVHGIHIGIGVAVILLLYWYLNGNSISLNNPFAHATSTGSQNGNGGTGFINVASFAGWQSVQYNSLGATAGALTGASN